jgi:integrase/recombinase XerD
MNLQDAIEGYLLFKSTRATTETIKTDTVLLNQFMRWRGNVDVTDVTPEDVRDYLDHQEHERGLSRHTVRRHHAVISAFYAWLSSPDVDLAPGNPAHAVKPPRPPDLKVKALTREQVEAMIAVTSQARLYRRARALVLFLLDTGARASEVTRLTVGDVNFASGKVKVRGKGDKERFVYLGKRALSALWLYVKEERPEPAQVDTNPLFMTGDGYALTRHTLRGIITRLGGKAGVKASTHAFRHTAAIEHLRHGMDLASLQHLLGHASVTTTRGYLEALSDEDVEERARRTSPGDNWRL